MDLKSLRESRGLSLAEFAGALGLSSKGYLSDLENSRTDMPIRLALEVEVWSHGEVTALELLGPADAELLRRAIARQAKSPELATTP